MRVFTVTIACENEAFTEAEGMVEVSKILLNLSDKLDMGEWNHYNFMETVRDSNGNDVGRAGFKEVEKQYATD